MTADPTNGDEPKAANSTVLSDLEYLPWWCGVVLTIADVLNRPWLSLAVAGFIIGRAGLRLGKRLRRPKC